MPKINKYIGADRNDYIFFIHWFFIYVFFLFNSHIYFLLYSFLPLSRCLVERYFLTCSHDKWEIYVLYCTFCTGCTQQGLCVVFPLGRFLKGKFLCLFLPGMRKAESQNARSDHVLSAARVESNHFSWALKVVFSKKKK